MATQLPVVLDTGEFRRSNKLTDLLDFAVADPIIPSDPSSKNYVDAQIAGISQGAFSGVVSGCGVAWTGGLNFTVSAGTYTIVGTSYSIVLTNLTLSAADP